MALGGLTTTLGLASCVTDELVPCGNACDCGSGAVAVLVTEIVLTQGLSTVFAGTGDPLQFLVLRKGTDAELTSTVTNDAYQIIRRLPGIATTPAGDPLVSPEGLTVVNLPNLEHPETGMNVTVRGLLPVGVAMRDVQVAKGRMFTPGLREVVVGEAIARRYPDAQIGGKLKFGRGEWQVVGVFKVGESAANSEIWADLDRLRGDFERAGGSSSVLVRAQSAAAMKELQKTIDDDQRLGVGTMGEKAYYASMTNSALPLQILGFSVAVIMAVLHRGMGLGLNVSFLSASAAVIIGVGAVLAAGYPDPGSPLATSDITASLFVILPNIVACIVVYLRVVRKASPERRATDAATGG